jgi:DNA-binding SARP family transcriptional activator
MGEMNAAGKQHRLRIRIFGATAVATTSTAEFAPVVGVKPRQILGMLAVRPGEPISKDQLAERLWDGRPPRSYVATLESYVCVLRRQLGVPPGRGGALATASRGYLLDPRHVDVDLARFREATDAADSAEPSEAVRLVDQALRLAQGQLLASEPYAPWAEDERRRFEGLLVRSCVGAGQLALARGDHGAAGRLATRALEVDPLAEPAWLVRMRGLAESSRRLEALRCFTAMRQVLDEQLGVEPGAEAQAMYLSLLRPVDASPPLVDGGAEVRALLDLLRSALEAVPGVVVPVEDHRLSAVAAELVGAA